MVNKISIITIVFNGKSQIEQTIKSVIEQEDVDIEYIVIDGGSTDGTVEIIKSYSQYINYFVSGPDGGIYQAINKGISFATRPLVGLIHCGDFYEKNVLKIVYNKYLKTGADIIYGNIDIREEVGNNVISHFPIADHLMLRNKMSIFHPSSFISLETYQKFGLYDVSYRLAADYDYLLKLFVNGCHFAYLPEVIAVFNAEGLSSKGFKLSLKENTEIRTKYNGRLNGFIYFLKKTVSNFYFSSRKQLITFLIGENTFNKIKSRKYTK
jgi:glycosyltransferase involved in cell wall biosynthesis